MANDHAHDSLNAVCLFQASSAVKVMAEQFAGMTRVTAEELQRAKNSIKSSIYMNLENRGIVMEDIGTWPNEGSGAPRMQIWRTLWFMTS